MIPRGLGKHALNGLTLYVSVEIPDAGSVL
jgi:hypothetical protein